MIKQKKQLNNWQRWCQCWLGLIVVLLLAVWLRIWRLGELPMGLNRDEAAIAYNAWLLVQTGKDEWQRSWPVFLESFGDYKLPGYPYTLALLFRWLSVTDWVVRLPSAIAGVYLVWLTWLLVKKMTGDRQWALVGAALIACNPIFIWYSRGAWEANVALVLLISAVYLVISQPKKKWSVWKLLLILVLLLFSFLTYNSPLLIMTVGMLVLPYFLWDRGWKFWLPLCWICVVAVVGSYTLLLPVVGQKGGITIFDDPTVHFHYLEYRRNLPTWLLPVIGSEKIYHGWLLVRSTLESFNPYFWWHGGSHPWHQLSDGSHLTLLTMVLVIIALILLCTKSVKSVSQHKCGWWRDDCWQWWLLLAISLVPSVITTDSPHATRSLLFFYLLMLLVTVSGWQAQERMMLVVASKKCGGKQLLAETKKNKKRNYLVKIWRDGIFMYQGKFNVTCQKLANKWRVMVLILVVMLMIEAGVYKWRFVRVLEQTNIYHQGWTEVIDKLDGEGLVIIESDEQPYEYIKVAWAAKITPELFWTTLIRQGADPAGIKGVTDMAGFHFVLPGSEEVDSADWWYYDKQKQRWERKK